MPIPFTSPISGVAPPRKRGFDSCSTCLVVFLLIIGIGIVLLVPAMKALRSAAMRSECSHGLRMIGLAMCKYHDKYGCFPPAFIADKNGKPVHSWRVLILPFMECDYLYKQYHFDEPWDSPHNKSLAQHMPAWYRCIVHGATGSETSYAMVVGPHAISDGPTSHKKSDIKDGLSNTIMVVEAVGAHINWMEPRDLNTAKMTFRVNPLDNGSTLSTSDISSDHAVPTVLFCDGSVRDLSEKSDPDVLRAMTTIDGREKIPSDDF
jgi:hypothetical protein